ncbi:YggT family protein [Candidatus Peregrinibacteria bacterium]|nr:YggT family protein [Candidatus Peregrinibacteria bacterium]
MNLTSFLAFFLQFVNVLGNLLIYAIIARVLLSWFSMGSSGTRGRVAAVIYDVTDPILNLVKKMPHTIGMIDLSPMIALIAIDLLKAVFLYFVAYLITFI